MGGVFCVDIRRREGYIKYRLVFSQSCISIGVVFIADMAIDVKRSFVIYKPDKTLYLCFAKYQRNSPKNLGNLKHRIVFTFFIVAFQALLYARRENIQSSVHYCADANVHI